MLGLYWGAAFIASLAVLATLPPPSAETSALPLQMALLCLLAVFAFPAIVLRNWLWPEILLEAFDTVRQRR
jgi:hypothetical protein